MSGISIEPKRDAGQPYCPHPLVRSVGGNTACPGSGADSKRTWKAQWRFRSTDPWSYVVNRDQQHIEYMSEDAAVRAANHTRLQALKINS